MIDYSVHLDKDGRVKLPASMASRGLDVDENGRLKPVGLMEPQIIAVNPAWVATVRKWADAIDAIERDGAEADDPEGARFITISDTIARIIAKELRGEHG